MPVLVSFILPLALWTGIFVGRHVAKMIDTWNAAMLRSLSKDPMTFAACVPRLLRKAGFQNHMIPGSVLFFSVTQWASLFGTISDGWIESVPKTVLLVPSKQSAPFNLDRYFCELRIPNTGCEPRFSASLRLSSVFTSSRIFVKARKNVRNRQQNALISVRREVFKYRKEHLHFASDCSPSRPYQIALERRCSVLL